MNETMRAVFDHITRGDHAMEVSKNVLIEAFALDEKVRCRVMACGTDVPGMEVLCMNTPKDPKEGDGEGGEKAGEEEGEKAEEKAGEKEEEEEEEDLAYSVTFGAGVSVGLGFVGETVGTRVSAIVDGGAAADYRDTISDKGISEGDWVTAVNDRDVSRMDKAGTIDVIKDAMRLKLPLTIHFHRPTEGDGGGEGGGGGGGGAPTKEKGPALTMAVFDGDDVGKFEEAIRTMDSFNGLTLTCNELIAVSSGVVADSGERRGRIHVLADAYRLVDKLHSNSLSKKRLMAGLRSGTVRATIMGIKTLAPLLDPARFEKTFSEMDKDGDGSIDLVEFVEFGLGASDQYVNRLFVGVK
jgi:Ca2+-binding EF-hand superfamily protein